MKRLRVSIMAAVVMSVCAGCVHRPEHVLSDSKMTPVFADMELAEAYYRVNYGLTAEDREALQRGILKKHGISQEDYDSTMAWYGRNIDKYYDLCDKVEKNLEKRQRKMVGSGNAEMETSDLWPYVRMAYVPVDGATDGLQFSVPTVDVKSGQRINLKMRLFSHLDGTVLMGVEYADGAKAYKTANVRDRKVDITLQTDTGRMVKRIFGNVILNMDSRRPVWIDSIALKALPYDSMEYYTIHSLHYQR